MIDLTWSSAAPSRGTVMRPSDRTTPMQDESNAPDEADETLGQSPLPADKKIFVADPSRGSRHNRGCAVDLTLYELASGEEVF